MEQSDLITTLHAARILSFHVCSIRRWAIQGKIPARKVFGRWRVSRAAVEALRELNRKGVEVSEIPEQDTGDYAPWVDAVLRKHGVI